MINYEKKLHTISFLLFILIWFFSCTPHKIIIPEWLQEHRKKRLIQFEQENKGLNKQNYIILLGNSITEGFPTETYFMDKAVLNRGIVADHTGIEGNGILQRLKVSVFDCRPSKIFLMIGINDLADKIFTTMQIAYGVKLIVQKILKYNPAIEINVQSILPTAGKYAYLNQKVLEYNQYLQNIATELEVNYIDLHPHFSNELGELNPHYTRDGLHLNNEAYRIWYALILPYLEHIG